MKSNNLKQQIDMRQKKWGLVVLSRHGSGLEPLTHPDSSEACSLFDTLSVISMSQQHKGVMEGCVNINRYQHSMCC